MPSGRRAIQSKWVFNLKRDKNGEVVKYKSRLVAKGCSQRFGVDYTETFSPVVRYSSLRLIFALAVEFDLHLHQMDVTTAYLNGTLQEVVYMVQPEQYVDKNYPEKVCRLKKSIYGLKQAGREWNVLLDSVFKRMGFTPCHTDACVYTKINGRDVNIIAVYVDDILLACSNLNVLLSFKHTINCEFDVVDKGPLDYFLGMEIARNENNIKLSHKQYIDNLLEEYGMKETRKCYTPLDPGQKFNKCDDCSNCKLVDTKSYQSIIGSLTYLATSTRPDIAHSISK